MNLHVGILGLFALVITGWFVGGPLSTIVRESPAQTDSAAVVATSVNVRIPAKATSSTLKLQKTRAALKQAPPIPTAREKASTSSIQMNSGTSSIAIQACAESSYGESCSFAGANGQVVSGTCNMPPRTARLVCIPTR